MAMDTRNKRASSVNLLSPWNPAPPGPDGTIAQGDRQHIAWTYGGISAATITGRIRRRVAKGWQRIWFG